VRNAGHCLCHWAWLEQSFENGFRQNELGLSTMGFSGGDLGLSDSELLGAGIRQIGWLTLRLRLSVLFWLSESGSIEFIGAPDIRDILTNFSGRI
jgi:hypothetical protein